MTADASLFDANPEAAPIPHPAQLTIFDTIAEVEAEEAAFLDNFWGDPIHVYTRAQGIADGVLVDVSETAHEAGFKWPVAMTREAWTDLVHWDEDTEKRKGFTGQSEAGRLWDVLNMARLAAHRGSGVETLYTMIRTPEPGRARQPRRVTVKLVSGPGDDAEPVITLMMPHES
jgi:hypothetical protein